LPGFDQALVIREFEELSDQRSGRRVPSSCFGTAEDGFYEEDSETEQQDAGQPSAKHGTTRPPLPGSVDADIGDRERNQMYRKLPSVL
jgi:hypothetical protein